MNMVLKGYEPLCRCETVLNPRAQNSFNTSSSVNNRYLNQKYYDQLCQFSEALWILLQSSITPNDIALAETLLEQFCSEFTLCYGKTSFTGL